MNKTNLTAGLCIAAGFACVPLYILELIGKNFVIGVFFVILTIMTLLVTGILGKIFNKKK